MSAHLVSDTQKHKGCHLTPSEVPVEDPVSFWRGWEAFVISIGYGMGDPLARSLPMGKESHSPISADDRAAPRKSIPLSEDREQWRGEAGPP